MRTLTLVANGLKPSESRRLAEAVANVVGEARAAIVEGATVKQRLAAETAVLADVVVETRAAVHEEATVKQPVAAETAARLAEAVANVVGEARAAIVEGATVKQRLAAETAVLQVVALDAQAGSLSDSLARADDVGEKQFEETEPESNRADKLAADLPVMSRQMAEESPEVDQVSAELGRQPGGQSSASRHSLDGARRIADIIARDPGRTFGPPKWNNNIKGLAAFIDTLLETKMEHANQPRREPRPLSGGDREAEAVPLAPALDPAAGERPFSGSSIFPGHQRDALVRHAFKEQGRGLSPVDDGHLSSGPPGSEHPAKEAGKDTEVNDVSGVT